MSTIEYLELRNERDKLAVRVAELEREVKLREAQTQRMMLARDAMQRERDEADAAAHLRALVAAARALVEYERKRHPPRMGGDEFPPSLRALMAEACAALKEFEP